MSDNDDDNKKKNKKSINIGSIISISHFKDKNVFICADGHINKEISLKYFGV